MKKHIPALTNHATSIYHYKKMKELMELERPTEREYEKFRLKMENDGHSLLMKDYTQAVKDLAIVQSRLENLKKML